MKCPKCAVDLKMSERTGIEIDYCPDCRGVWLDRGELDKIIERSSVERPELSRSHDDSDDRFDDRRHSPHDPRKRKKSFFGELFDFD